MVKSLLLLLFFAPIGADVALESEAADNQKDLPPPHGPAATPTKCLVYQYSGVDSTARQLVLTRRYHPSGRVLQEDYDRYQLSHQYMASKGQERCRYRDTTLVERLEIDERGDQIKTRYFHDSQNRVTREERLTNEHRQKKNVDKGNGRPGGCILVASDFHKHRSWEKTSVIYYGYDAQGHRVSYNAPTLHYSSQNRYTWAYDSLGRLSKHTSYDRERVLWVEDYTYFPGGHRFTRTWYDEADGGPAQLKPQNKGYWPQYATVYQCNEHGQVKVEETTSEKGVLSSRTLRYYNAQQQLVKTVYQNEKSEVKLTHLFVYQ